MCCEEADDRLNSVWGIGFSWRSFMNLRMDAELDGRD